MAGRRGPAGKGRKKVVIQPIENQAARDVCFSKRRKGLFSKASQLAVMCGAEVAAVVYSPAGNAYSFGHPSAEDIINRFLGTGGQDGAAGARQLGAAVDRNRLAELQQEYNKLGKELAAMDERKESWGEAMAKDRAEGSQAAAWLDAVADRRDMGDADKLACAASLREAQVAVSARVNQVLQDGRREQQAALAARVNQVLQAQKAPLGPAALPPQLLAGGGGFELGGTSVNGWTEQMIQQEQIMTVMPTPGFAGGVGFELGGTSANGVMEEMMSAIASGGGFEFGGTSANDGMEENFQQQQMVTAMPQLPGLLAGGGGFELGGTSADGGMYEMMMTAMPPPLGFATGMEMMQQQEQQMMPSGMMPTPPGLAAGMEMQQQQTMTEPPPLPAFAAGTEMMQQQEMMAATPPPAPGFTAGMEMMHQESGPYGSFPN
uniref:MADS-box domain-containing protein n=1 Tax=Hordeum vulgare subsp. vulgare TaxID=112509 RepID=A0A8I6X4W1_HORVV